MFRILVISILLFSLSACKTTQNKASKTKWYDGRMTYYSSEGYQCEGLFYLGIESNGNKIISRTGAGKIKCPNDRTRKFNFKTFKKDKFIINVPNQTKCYGSQTGFNTNVGVIKMSCTNGTYGKAIFETKLMKPQPKLKKKKTILIVN
ncbi:MAG: hypothetical protein HRU28_15045 [Rhizobiales bacterium]|nr:hypothetical protein [Hyphomicrobiales bacterium]